MSARSLFQFLAVVVCLAGLGSAPLPAQAGPSGRTSVTVGDDAIRIKARIEISGELATAALAAVIEGDINSVWQAPGNQHTYCGRKIEFEAEVRVAQGPGTQGWHQIYIEPLRPGQYFRSNVSGGHRNAYDMDLGGTWTPYGAGERTDHYTYAHEAGHLFGAPDEYVEADDGEAYPNPGREISLMADGAPVIDAGIVNNLLQTAFPEGDQSLPLCIQGTYYETIEEKTAEMERAASLELALMLQTTPEGELKGTATGEFNVGGSYTQGDCEFAYSLSSPIELELTATGSGDGPYAIAADLPILVEDTQRHFLCAQAIDLVLEWTVDLNLTDVVFGEFTLANGQVLQRQYDLDQASADGELKVHLWLMGLGQ